MADGVECLSKIKMNDINAVTITNIESVQSLIQSSNCIAVELLDIHTAVS